MSKSTFATYIEESLKKWNKLSFDAKKLAELVAKENPEYLKERMASSGKDRKQQIEQFTREIYSASSRGRLGDKVSVTTDSPKQFTYIQSVKTSNRTIEQREQQLYKICCEYLASGLNLYSKRIDEKRSSNKRGKNGNAMLFPDIVGVKILSENYCDCMQQFIKHHKSEQTELYSFEVKCELNSSNVRINFFQTVSNSSWAHCSYLVAPKIDENAMRELQILCRAYNVGLIKLNEKNPLESQIVIPAKVKEKLDLNIMNRICEENKDFKDFIKSIETFYATSIDQLRLQNWDDMPDV